MSVAAFESQDIPQLKELLKLYYEAEVYMVRQIAHSLERGITVPEWQERKVLELQLMQEKIRNYLAGITGRSLSLIDGAIDSAYARGNYAALGHERAIASGTKLTTARSSALRALAWNTQQAVLSTHLMALRATEDIYRRVIQQTVVMSSSGVMTRRQAAQIALNRFAAQGVVGFKDAAGRNWSMPAYTEMTMRTATIRASVQGKTDRWQERGKNLVYVSDHTQECERCRPWEGKVLALGSLEEPAVATLSDAQSQGLMHPGCRHTVNLYIPGLSRPKAEADPQGDADRQRLRAMERNVRAWRLRKEAAISPDEKAKATAKVKEWTKNIKDHTANTSAKRQPFRESNTQAR